MPSAKFAQELYRAFAYVLSFLRAHPHCVHGGGEGEGVEHGGGGGGGGGGRAALAGLGTRPWGIADGDDTRAVHLGWEDKREGRAKG